MVASYYVDITTSHDQQPFLSHPPLLSGQVNPVEPAGQPRPEPPRPAPEFNMKANDFPSLPGVPDPAPNTEPARFLDVVKGTSKMKLDDDQDTLPDDFIADEVEPEPAVEQDSVSVSPKPRSKNSSVSESQTVTPVVSVERPLSPPSDGLVSPPLVNGDAGPGKVSKSVPVVSINTNNDRDSGSVSPRQQSLVSVSACVYSLLINIISAGTVRSEVDLRSNNEEEAGEGSEGSSRARGPGGCGGEGGRGRGEG